MVSRLAIMGRLIVSKCFRRECAVGWVVLAALLAYAVHCLGRPVAEGRDFGSYWLY